MPAETVVFELAGMDEVDVIADRTYKSVEGNELLFDVYRPPSVERPAVVVFVHGDGPPEVLADAKGWGQYTSWGRLVAASGLAGVTFNHRSSLGATELHEAASDVDDLIAHVREQSDELGLDPDRMCIWTCSAGGPIGMRVALGSHEYVRCAVCFYGMLDLRHLSHPDGRHGFDVLDDDDRSREIVARTLDFMRRHLLGSAEPSSNLKGL